VLFMYKRKMNYRDLHAVVVRVTFYPQIEQVAGMVFEYIEVVRIRVSW